MLKNLENFLCDFHNKKYALIVGNGTTAIYLGIKSSLKKIKYVGIPNNSCIHLPIAIKLANCKPIFFDIEKNGYGIDINSLKKSKIDCLINVHSYGKPTKIDLIKKICQKKKIFLIEDVAVAQGGFYKKTPLGSFGDVSILSFGKGKVLDAGLGGAILTDSSKVYNLSKKLLEKFKLVNNKNLKNVEFINNMHTKFYNDYFLRNKKVDFEKFRYFIKKKSKHFLFKLPEKKKSYILKKCRNLKFYISIRRSNFIKFRDKILKLKKRGIFIPKIINGEIPWRLNLFFKDSLKRDKLIKELLFKNIQVSSWYSGLDLFFEKNYNFKNSEAHSKSIINFWVNKKKNSIYQKKIIKFIEQI